MTTILSSLLTGGSFGHPSFLEEDLKPYDQLPNSSESYLLNESNDSELQQLLDINSIPTLQLPEEWNLFDQDFNDLYDTTNYFSDASGSPVTLSPLSLSPPDSTIDQQEIEKIVSSLQDDEYSHSLTTSSPPPPPAYSPNYVQVVPTLPLSPPPPSPLTPPPPPKVKLPKKPGKLTAKDRKLRKKSQNKTAALRYRQKKKDELEDLLQKEKLLESKNNELKKEVDGLVNEIRYLNKLWSDVCQAKESAKLK